MRHRAVAVTVERGDESGRARGCGPGGVIALGRVRLVDLPSEDGKCLGFLQLPVAVLVATLDRILDALLDGGHDGLGLDGPDEASVFLVEGDDLLDAVNVALGVDASVIDA